jgi:hypothetical protein
MSIMEVRQGKNFPKKIIDDVIKLVFPDSYFVGRGFFKEVHAIHSPAHTRAGMLQIFDVRFGSFATDVIHASAIQCPRYASNSDQTPDMAQRTLCARSRH